MQSYRRIASSLLAAGMVVGLSIAASAKGNNGPCGYNVTSILNDYDTQTKPFQLQSDGLGSYVTETLKTDQVSSVIQQSCSWALNTTDSTSRGLNLTLADPASNNQPAPPFAGPQLIHGVINNVCQLNPANNSLSFGSMTSVGQTLSCPTAVSFSFSGKSYVLELDPQKWAGTSYMQVTCQGLDPTSHLCSMWTAVPDPTTSGTNGAGQVAAIGELYEPASKGKSQVALGLYYVSFSIAVHK